MTTTHNSSNSHLSANQPSRWVVRFQDTLMSHHKTAKDAVRWLHSHHPDTLTHDLLKAGWTISQSYTATARYWAKHRPFAVEFEAERPTFDQAMDALAAWLHKSWEQDRDNHPSPAGRHQAWERWHDVIALANVATLTLIPNPSFRYAFGPLSPPEGKGYDLRLLVVPTPAEVLEQKVRHRV